MADYPLLRGIDSPQALRQLPESELPALAEELRQYTIDIVADSGGHLGASLGVVELTVAIHYIFDTPEDQLVWDVGHQSYPHKILTGRRDRMPTLRRRGGISGFTKRDESPYDPFGAGHSSTSISAALGLATGARLRHQHHKSIAVIGDGALGAGMAFEALNNAGHVRDNGLVVILNDNEMSISPNVGALSAYLSRIWSGRFYTGLKDRTGRVLSRLAPPLREAAKRAEEHVKGLLTPGTLFEELGFTYFGPIDGHDFDQLLPTLRNIKRLSDPILLHVITRKGRGFPPAEANPCTYHGVRPFDRQTGAFKPNGDATPSYTQVFAEGLIDLAQRDPALVAITAAMPEGTGLNLFQERFPTRFFDVGIAEQHAVTFAAGLACAGMHPVVAIYSTFLQRAYDQIIHDVALQNLPVVFALDRAGLVGADGATHAGAYDLSFLRCVPNLLVMAPADENELRHLLATAVGEKRPCALRYPRGNALGLAPEPVRPLPVGVGRRLRQGADGALVAVGPLVHTALEVARRLEERGHRLAVYDPRWIKPLDRRLLREAAAHPLLVTLEENSVLGGFGAAVLEFLAADGLLDRGLRVRTWGLPDRFIPHGEPREQRREAGLDPDSLEQRLLELLEPGTQS